MAEAPNSYKDPFWSDLASGVEQKLDLPSGLLVSVLQRGERSNADQVSEAGARTPFQIIPATRKAAVEKYGIDPYLSPENAAEVAGRLLKDSLDRNKGDAEAAVAEYHGGTDPANWGPRTRSYVRRVMSGVPQPSQQAPQSTFQRALAAQQSAQPDQAAISNVFRAYEAGQMTADEAREFEQDVRAGLVMLPRGASLKGEKSRSGAGNQKPEPILLPQAITNAYVSGQLPDRERADLEADIASGLVRLPPTASSQIPTGPGFVPPTEQGIIPREQSPTLAQRAIGTGEAALSVATGFTSGAAGGLTGFAKGVANDVVGLAMEGRNYQRAPGEGPTDLALRGMTALTYAPRTEQGQSQLGVVAEAGQALAPLTGLGPQAAALAQASRVGAQAASPVARTAASNLAPAAQRAQQAVSDAVAGAAQRVGLRSREARPTPGTMASGGSAGTDMALQRQTTAEMLGFTGESALTKGQMSRDPAQLKFEVETAKLPDQGGPLRERLINQNQRALQFFDNAIDQTGAQAPTLRAVGQAVDQALVKQYARDKAMVNSAYRKANQSPEARALVDQERPVSIGEGDNAITATPLSFLNEQPSGLPNTALVDAARQYATRIGVAEMRDGQLVPRQATIKQMEDWRKAIGQAAGYDPVEIRQSTILKKLIDAQTEPVAGPLFRDARNMRARLAQNYEDRATIAKLLNTKRGTSDRQVAFEDVFKHTILDGSLDDVRNVERVLARSGAEGKQAWRELQGATVQWLKEQATRNVATDSAGNRVISAAGLDKAIRALDTDGKLSRVVGKQGAQTLRDLNDLVKYFKTVPPEAAVNTSNSASTLMAAFLDAVLIGSTGGLVPVPIASLTRIVRQHIRDKALRRRIEDALNRIERKQAPNNKGPNPEPAQAPRVLH